MMVSVENISWWSQYPKIFFATSGWPVKVVVDFGFSFA